MSKFSRRRLIGSGLGAAAGASVLVAAGKLADRYGLIPPDHSGLYGVGETLTYASQRLLMAGGSAAREFDRSAISKVLQPNGGPPEDDTFRRLLAGRFADWRLMVDGMVDRPASFSLTELKGLPSRSQITQLGCEEGWSFIAEWTGVPLSGILESVGAQPQARYVVYYSLDSEWWDSIDMPEALHPQTLITYGMNGAELPLAHGAPVRLRVPRQLGYKSVKHLARITVTDSLKEIGDGQGSASPAAGFAWYAGI